MSKALKRVWCHCISKYILEDCILLWNGCQPIDEEEEEKAWLGERFSFHSVSSPFYFSSFFFFGENCASVTSFPSLNERLAWSFDFANPFSANRFIWMLRIIIPPHERTIKKRKIQNEDQSRCETLRLRWIVTKTLFFCPLWPAKLLILFRWFISCCLPFLFLPFFGVVCIMLSVLLRAPLIDWSPNHFTRTTAHGCRKVY